MNAVLCQDIILKRTFYDRLRYGARLILAYDAHQTRDIVLVATSTDFNGWTAHPEVGGGGESGEGEHSGASGEHTGEHGNEHN